MSGHLVVENLSWDEMDETASIWTKNEMKPPILGADVMHAQGTSNKGSQHVFQGWTAATRQELTRALAGNMGENRENLPPHKYFEFPVGQVNQKCATYIKRNYEEGGWVSRLSYPNMGLKTLHADALAFWIAGDHWQAVVKQIFKAGLRVEVYKVDDDEIS